MSLRVGICALQKWIISFICRESNHYFVTQWKCPGIQEVSECLPDRRLVVESLLEHFLFLICPVNSTTALKNEWRYTSTPLWERAYRQLYLLQLFNHVDKRPVFCLDTEV